MRRSLVPEDLESTLLRGSTPSLPASFRDYGQLDGDDWAERIKTLVLHSGLFRSYIGVWTHPRTCPIRSGRSFDYGRPHRWANWTSPSSTARVASPALTIEASSVPGKTKPYIDEERCREILDVLVEPEWKLWFGLGRYGGLRMPSEGLVVRSRDIDLGRGFMRVRSQKTKRFKGRASRIVLILPQLRDLIERCVPEDASEHDFVTGSLPGAGTLDRTNLNNDNVRSNISKAFKRHLKAGGVTVWPQLMQALRASARTDFKKLLRSAALAAEYARHDEEVGEKYYETDGEREAQAERDAKLISERLGNSQMQENNDAR